MNTEKKITQTVNWIKEKVEAAGQKGVCVGLSGGIDSALCAKLMKMAFPDDSLALILPIKSSRKDEEDAEAVAESIGITCLRVELSQNHEDIMKQILVSEGKERNLRAADSNLRARLRMCTIYAIANLKNYLVVGTDNMAELYTGYFTKYGDGACDILPIAGLLKSEVYEWSRFLGLPSCVLEKAPSAGLWEGQTDESEMGTTYDIIDGYLKSKNGPPEDLKIIKNLHLRTMHKRTEIPKYHNHLGKEVSFKELFGE